MPNTYPFFYSVQITEEANFTDGPDCIDGAYPNVRQALIEGVVEATQTLQRLGHPDVKVGFNSTPTFGPGVEFWRNLGSLGGQRFLDALDYVGLDFFPDVFPPAAPDGETGDVKGIRIGRAGGDAPRMAPRSRYRPACANPYRRERLADPPHSFLRTPIPLLETTIRAIYEARERLNIEGYTMFALRDTDSSKPELADNIFYHFGLTRDDYGPKPAYGTFRGLIQQLGPR